MYESNINNEKTITAKPIVLDANQNYSQNLIENTYNFGDNNFQDNTNQYILNQNDQNIDVSQNYQTTDNLQAFQSTPTPITTTENFEQFQYESQPQQNIIQSTPVTTQSFNQFQYETQPQQNIIQSTPIVTTDANTFQGLNTVQEPTFAPNYNTSSKFIQENKSLPIPAQPTYQVLSQPVNQVVSQQQVTQNPITISQEIKGFEVKTVNQNKVTNSHFVTNYPIYENDPRRVAFYNNQVKVYNTYRLVKPVPIINKDKMLEII